MTERLDRVETILASVAEQQQVNTTAISTLTEQQNQAQMELRESINDVVAMIGNLAQQQEQRSEESRQRDEESRRRHEETEQRFNNLLADARADRQLNESEHRAFRETFQTLLAEISRIWRRIAG